MGNGFRQAKKAYTGRSIAVLDGDRQHQRARLEHEQSGDVAAESHAQDHRERRAHGVRSGVGCPEHDGLDHECAAASAQSRPPGYARGPTACATSARRDRDGCGPDPPKLRSVEQRDRDPSRSRPRTRSRAWRTMWRRRTGSGRSGGTRQPGSPDRCGAGEPQGAGGRRPAHRPNLATQHDAKGNARRNRRSVVNPADVNTCGTTFGSWPLRARPTIRARSTRWLLAYPRTSGKSRRAARSHPQTIHNGCPQS